jgi:hypothetical protein
MVRLGTSCVDTLPASRSRRRFQPEPVHQQYSERKCPGHGLDVQTSEFNRLRYGATPLGNPEITRRALTSTSSLSHLGGHQLDASAFATHDFALDEFDHPYDVFSHAGETGALKVVLHGL